MKKVSLPKKRVTIGTKSYSAEDVIAEIVMTRTGWRRLGSTKIGLAISEKLDIPGDKLFTDMEHDMLVKEAAMQDTPGGIAPVEMNRFYLEVLQSLYDAKDVVEDPERQLAAAE
jgi:hypothetical protein